MKKIISLFPILFLMVACSTLKTKTNSNSTLNRQISQERLSAEPHFDQFNLYETNWNIFKDIPIYNQSALPACYAYASSQLTEYYLRQSKQLDQPHEHVSPLWGAYLFKDKSGSIMTPMNWVKRTVGYGFSRVTINQLRKYGICKSSVIQKNLEKLVPSFPESEGSVVGLIELVWPHKDLNSEEEILSQIQDNRAYIRALRSYFSRYDSQSQQVADENLDKRVLLPQIRAVKDLINQGLSQLDKKTYLNFFEKYILAGCDNEDNIKHFDISKVKVAGQMYASNKKISRKIKEAFEAVNLSYPISVGYCSNIYKPEDEKHRIKPRSVLLPRIFDRALNSPENCSAHYSLVVGRRIDPMSGNPELLIRNSYGNTFMPKSQGCFCRNTQTESFENCAVTDQNPINPEKHLVVLGCWIDEKKLTETVYDINHISIKSAQDLAETEMERPEPIISEDRDQLQSD